MAGENLRLKTSHKNRGLCNFSRIYSILHTANTFDILKQSTLYAGKNGDSDETSVIMKLYQVIRTKQNSQNPNREKKKLRYMSLSNSKWKLTPLPPETFTKKPSCVSAFHCFGEVLCVFGSSLGQ